MNTIDPDAQCPIHGVSRHSCDADHDTDGALRERAADHLPAAFGENTALCASPIACAVADAFVRGETLNGAWRSDADIGSELTRGLRAIELATRESPLRKVRP